eukprot:GFUD01019778.1.p1 GENE.GFUD01019778.1~~GFUD01019778.1.p1  ORF type:complete len:216 (+),score=55.21 GFUD01019778.1:26-649(+)
MAGIERVLVDLTQVKEALIPIIWVIGGPGSGRSTQCEYLQARHGWVHLSSGTLMRNEVMSGSKRGSQLFSVMQSGELVPHAIVLDILAQKMVEKVQGASGFLIDGFPLDMEEATAFESAIVPVTRVIHLKMETNEMFDRLKKRDNFDDQPNSIQKRIETFTAKTLPVIEKYCHKIVQVDATKPVHEITEEMLKALTGELEHGGRSVL